jgi:tetratricopeptide (TPR) repeat protein
MQVVTNIPMGLLYHAVGDYRRAIEFFQWNVDRLERDSTHERFGLFGLPSVFSRVFLAYCYSELGEFAKANAVVEEAISIATAADHTFSQVYAYLGLGYLHIRKGDFERGIAVLERALELGQFSQIPVAFAYGASYLGYALVHAGRVTEGLALLERTTDEAISSRFVARHSLRLVYLSEAYLLAGRYDAAAATAQTALDLAQKHKERGHEAYALRVMGEVERLHDPAAAATYYRDALQISNALSMRPLEAQCHWGLARLLRETEGPERSVEHIALAKALFRDMEMTSYLRQLDADFQNFGAKRLSTIAC